MRKLSLICLIVAVAVIAGVGQEQRAVEPAYSVPDLNGRATLLIDPTFSNDAELDGTTLFLRVVIDTMGNVVSAMCSTRCSAAAARAAEEAALASKFLPLIQNGKAVPYSGTLMYSIAIEKIDWFRFGEALQSAYISDNLSLGAVSAMLTVRYSDAKILLQGLDGVTDLESRWKAIDRVRDSLINKLGKKDAWVFKLGVAVRNVTAPFQSDKRLDRAELQTAIGDLGSFLESPPIGVSEALLNGVRDLSLYRISDAISNQNLRTDLFRLTGKITRNFL